MESKMLTFWPQLFHSHSLSTYDEFRVFFLIDSGEHSLDRSSAIPSAVINMHRESTSRHSFSSTSRKSSNIADGKIQKPSDDPESGIHKTVDTSQHQSQPRHEPANLNIAERGLRIHKKLRASDPHHQSGCASQANKVISRDGSKRLADIIEHPPKARHPKACQPKTPHGKRKYRVVNRAGLKLPILSAEQPASIPTTPKITPKFTDFAATSTPKFNYAVSYNPDAKFRSDDVANSIKRNGNFDALTNARQDSEFQASSAEAAGLPVYADEVLGGADSGFHYPVYFGKHSLTSRVSY